MTQCVHITVVTVTGGWRLSAPYSTDSHDEKLKQKRMPWKTETEVDGLDFCLISIKLINAIGNKFY